MLKATDTVSLNIVLTKDANDEIRKILNSVEYYITPDNEIAFSANTDTLEMLMGYMTKIPDGVKLSTEDLSNEDNNGIPGKYKKIYNDSNLKDYYYATKDGEIYKITDNGKKIKEMKPFTTKDGYLEYVLTTNDGKKKHIQGQRLIAITYLGKPKGKNMQVNHKNGNRKDNRVKNLEWVSAKENIRHSFDKLGKKVWNDPEYKKS